MTMKSKYLPLLVLSLLLYIATESRLNAQEIDLSNTLRDQWTSLIKSSESYNEHKIIKLTKLQDFRGALNDSLSDYSKHLSTLKSESAQLKSEVESLKSDLVKISSEWQLSQTTNAEIGFLGMNFRKSFYNAMVWSIIALLSVVVFVMYTRIKRVCSVVKRVKSAYSRISDEYRSHRYQAKEHQIRLKRELQTALNKLEMAE
jgi:archaellum component FlaC